MSREFKKALQEAIQLDPSKGEFVKRDEEEVLILTEVGESAWGNGLAPGASSWY